MVDAEPISVLLVDDHPVVRDGYKRLLENAGDIQVIGEAGTGEEAYRFVAQQRPDVVVLDLNMPGFGGLETLRKMLARDAKIRILIFSMYDNETLVSRAMEAGAAGYLSKSSPPGQMVEAVRTVAQGKPYLNNELLPALVHSTLNERDPLKRLTQREFEVFMQLANGKSVADIAEVLHLSPKTVGVHQTNIMKKLELRNVAELTRLAIRSELIQA